MGAKGRNARLAGVPGLPGGCERPGSSVGRRGILPTDCYRWPDSLRRQNSPSVEVGAGATVRDLLASLAIRPSEVGLVVLNGRAADSDRQLREGDRILVWPLVVGG